MIQSFGTVLDEAAIQAKQRKLFDLSVINDVLHQTEAGRWPSQIRAIKITGKDGHRTLTLGCDSATALLISHDLSGILARINPLLEDLAVDNLKIQHETKLKE